MVSNELRFRPGRNARFYQVTGIDTHRPCNSCLLNGALRETAAARKHTRGRRAKRVIDASIIISRTRSAHHGSSPHACAGEALLSPSPQLTAPLPQCDFPSLLLPVCMKRSVSGVRTTALASYINSGITRKNHRLKLTRRICPTPQANCTSYRGLRQLA